MLKKPKEYIIIYVLKYNQKHPNSSTYICESVIHNVKYFWGLEIPLLWQSDLRHYKAEEVDN